MTNCLNCQSDNLNDGPLCPTCASGVHFTHQAQPEIVEINGLSEPTEYAVVDENFRVINVTPEEAGIDPNYEAYWAARENCGHILA